MFVSGLRTFLYCSTPTWVQSLQDVLHSQEGSLETCPFHFKIVGNKLVSKAAYENIEYEGFDFNSTGPFSYSLYCVTISSLLNELYPSWLWFNYLCCKIPCEYFNSVIRATQSWIIMIFFPYFIQMCLYAAFRNLNDYLSIYIFF